MPIRINLPETCGLGLALSVIGGRWKSVILWELHERPLRFGALRRRLPGISEKVLYEQLREMERDGVVRREVFEEAVLRVEYSLTSAGAALNDAAHVLAEWGLAHAGRSTLQAAAE
ncbi:helix-turn-helix domain-containing protein [Bosea vestrisii]|uniref:winged helix-turn-helix transcriptional regulator n=1 Tax=Bosea vestrisii TaxID=151416 RepID=UPI0024DF613C|nr:helix-turn-helix domain-containing protein [Bosea vestrisii]WID98906.1 helix-turn-helix domain-containing protein [Bosea vestrisii]